MRSHLVFSVPLALALAAFVSVVVSQPGFTTVQVGDYILDISNYELPWADAVSTCFERGTSLLVVNSVRKDEALVDAFINGGVNVSLPGNNTWIAATETREGAWSWTTPSMSAQPLFYDRWMIGQPDDLDNINCAYQAVQALLYWRDANCSAPMYFICESPVPVPPTGTIVPVTSTRPTIAMT